MITWQQVGDKYLSLHLNEREVVLDDSVILLVFLYFLASRVF